jgi:hypothetical protein
MNKRVKQVQTEHVQQCRRTKDNGTIQCSTTPPTRRVRTFSNEFRCDIDTSLTFTLNNDQVRPHIEFFDDVKSTYTSVVVCLIDVHRQDKDDQLLRNTKRLRTNTSFVCLFVCRFLDVVNDQRKRQVTLDHDELDERIPLEMNNRRKKKNLP